MDTSQLAAFTAVAELGSFSAAAQQLSITQPAVSKRIALLESALDKRLFDRIGRRVTLTEAGLALLPHAQAIEHQLQAATQSVGELDGEVRGALRIATSHHIGLHRLPPVLQAFTRHYPEVRLRIDFMDSEQAHDAVLQGQAELAIVTLAPEARDTVVSTPLWRDTLQIMVAPGHPLLQTIETDAAPCTLAQLASHAAVMPGLGTYTGQIVKQLFDRAGLGLNISMTTNYLETLRMLAAVGLGWTVLPGTMLSEQLRTLPVSGVSLERQLGHIIHRDRSPSRAASAMTSTLRAVADV